MMKKILCLAALSLLLVPRLGATDNKLEKQLEKTLSQMTLDQKIGQIIQLEINQITYYHPEYELTTLVGCGADRLGALIEKAGLGSRYHAEEMVRNLDPDDFATVYPFYLLSVDLAATEDFIPDEKKMETVFGQYHVGSLINMLGGMYASNLDVWQRSIARMEEASLRYNGLPLIYGLDQVHGPTYIAGGTMFPQQLGMAATFNAPLVKELGEMNAYETRAGGVRWSFGPSMDLGVKPSWSRFYETWGEDPYLTTVMAGSYMSGLQGPDPDHIDAYHVAACLKHYLGYGAPDSGMDRTPATISPENLKEKHFEPFRQAALDGVLSVMTNSSLLNGIPGVCNRELITEWLKEGLDWDGVVVTDWSDVQELYRLFKVVPTVKEGIGLAMNAGIDMIMVPSSLEYGPLLKELVDEGVVSMERIDDAVRRILRLKYRVGLFDKKPAKAEYPLFGSEQFARKAYQAAVESEVLLKNEDKVLPLPTDARILLCGPNADTMRGLSGGWTYSWQGSNVEKLSEPYHTIFEAMQQRFSNVVYEPGVEYDLSSSDWWAEKAPEIEKAVAASADVDYIVCCVGENSYAETTGSTRDLLLSENQRNLVKALAATGKPVILVLNEGRPRIIRDIEPCVNAVVDVMLPSNYGGDALAALLSGEENFSGRLPFTYPSYANALSTYNYKVMEDRFTTPGIYNYENHAAVQWWFGEGLSYTSYSYSNISVDKTDFRKGDGLVFSLDVTNTGDRAGLETVLLFVADDVASLMPDNRRLRAFTKVSLEPGETRRVTLRVAADDLAFVGLDGLRHLEAGSFTVMVGGEYLKINCTETAVW